VLDPYAPALREFHKSKLLAWNPRQIELAEDARDWAELAAPEHDTIVRTVALLFGVQSTVAAHLASLLVGLRRRGYPLEESLFGGAQLFEVARQVDAFDRWLVEVGAVVEPLDYGGASADYRALTREALPGALDALLSDPGDAALARALCVCHLLTEGMLVDGSLSELSRTLRRHEILPGLTLMLDLCRRDTLRHVDWAVETLARLSVAGEPLPLREVLAYHVPQVAGIFAAVFAPWGRRIPLGFDLDRLADEARAQLAARLSATRRPVVLSIGKFDGVHLGHRHIVRALVATAAERGARSTALVLHPDPVAVLTGRPVPMLTTVAERRERLLALGVDEVAPLDFNHTVSRLGPDAFLDDLGRRFDLAAMVVGPDFAFGRDRSGDVAALRALGAARGFDVICVEPWVVDGAVVSSRRIRACVEAGDIAMARAMLAAPPRLGGTVVHGARRGRALGFPTANLALGADYVVPAHGIYTVRAALRGAAGVDGVAPGAPVHSAARTGESSGSSSVAGSGESGGLSGVAATGGSSRTRGVPGAPTQTIWLDGVASIGVRPTFDSGPRSIEVHLLDFDGDLYGQGMVVEFLAWQRSEARFDSVEALVAQMHADVAIARVNLKAETAAEVAG